MGWLVTTFAPGDRAYRDTVAPKLDALLGSLCWSFLVFGLSNVGTALAPTFELLIAARFLGGMAHGLFWSVVFTYSAYLVRSDQLTRATSITALGGSLAGILGIPIGNALGQLWGWRLAFGSFAVLCLLVTIVLARLLV